MAGPKKHGNGGSKKKEPQPLTMLLPTKKVKATALDADSAPFSVSEDTVEFMMSSAAIAYELELFDEALRIYKAVAAARPKWARPRVGLGAVSYRKGDLESAERAYRDAIALDPKNQEALLYLGELLWQSRGLVVDAKNVLVKALELDPMNVFGSRAQIVLIDLMRDTAARLNPSKGK